MKNSEYYKKKTKIAKKNITESSAYKIPIWPIRKTSNILTKSTFWAIRKLEKEHPIARFVEYEKDDKKKVNGREKKYIVDDILDGVLKRIAESKKELNKDESKFTSEYFKDNDSLNEIKNLIENQINDEKDEKSLFKIANKDNNVFQTHFVEESNWKIKVHGKGIINYDKIIKNERNRLANQISVFTQKYLEKKPKDRQFIEEEDLNSDNGSSSLKKYIEDRIKREEISYLKVIMVALPVLAVGVTMCVALSNPVTLAIGALLICASTLVMIGSAVYKNSELSVDKLTNTIKQENQDRFENLKKEVQLEKIRRKEEKERGVISTGLKPKSNLPLSTLDAQDNNIPILDGVSRTSESDDKFNHQQNLQNSKKSSNQNLSASAVK
jgi:hypothetical protein